MTYGVGREGLDQLRVRLLRGFPTAARADAETVVDLVPAANYSSAGLIQESNNAEWPAVTFGGERLEIPRRIYNDFPAREFTLLAPASKAAAGCFYTRHHDGRTRQLALRLALSHDVEWCAPFLVQLLSEYVVEICIDIERFLADASSTHPNVFRGLKHFTESNPDFMALTRDRATSYWATYYRAGFATAGDYPAMRALRCLEGRAR